MARTPRTASGRALLERLEYIRDTWTEHEAESPTERLARQVKREAYDLALQVVAGQLHNIEDEAAQMVGGEVSV